MDILNLEEKPITDEMIEEYEYHEYEPITGTNLNNPGEIRITIQNQDIFTHPSESYLLVEARLTKDDDTAFADTDVNTRTNNGIMHLFSNIKYQLSEQEVVLSRSGNNYAWSFKIPRRLFQSLLA